MNGAGARRNHGQLKVCPGKTWLADVAGEARIVDRQAGATQARQELHSGRIEAAIAQGAQPNRLTPLHNDEAALHRGGGAVGGVPRLRRQYGAGTHVEQAQVPCV